ncbi:MAG: hypothetical protein QOJ99_4837 [Bryobacterales bacterium]|nr:hypothetical protein [Bryobacterales bacterium]
MAFEPSAASNSPSITHLASYLSRYPPTNSSDEPNKEPPADIANKLIQESRNRVAQHCLASAPPESMTALFPVFCHEAIGSAVPGPWKKVERPRWKMDVAIAFIDEVSAAYKKATNRAIPR